jgi:hypothetical protein
MEATMKNQYLAAAAGIAGKTAISIAGGKHSYEFEYTLPKPE